MFDIEQVFRKLTLRGLIIMWIINNRARLKIYKDKMLQEFKSLWNEVSMQKNYRMPVQNAQQGYVQSYGIA